MHAALVSWLGTAPGGKGIKNRGHGGCHSTISRWSSGVACKCDELSVYHVVTVCQGIFALFLSDMFNIEQAFQQALSGNGAEVYHANKACQGISLISKYWLPSTIFSCDQVHRAGVTMLVIISSVRPDLAYRLALR